MSKQESNPCPLVCAWSPHRLSSPLDSRPLAVPPAGQRDIHSWCLCLLPQPPCSLLPPAGIRAQIGFSKVKLVQAGKGQEIWGIWISLASCPPPPPPNAPLSIMHRNLARAENLWITEQRPRGAYHSPLHPPWHQTPPMSRCGGNGDVHSPGFHGHHPDPGTFPW